MLSSVTELHHNWKLVKVPLPFSLKWVNSYIIPDSSGYTIIDPGLRTDEAIGLWEKVLEYLNIEWHEIKKIIVTHQHPDHYGLAGFMQERSAAPVFMSSLAHQYARRLWGTEAESDYNDALLALFAKHGMPQHLLQAIDENLGEFRSRVLPHPEVTYIQAGEIIAFGDRQWLLIDAPGHAFGQLCLFNEEEQIMFCGDQVLDRITPNISIVPGEEQDPLHCFLTSLEQLKQYKVRLALPGHRDPIVNFAERIKQLQQHHARRLDKMLEQLQAGSYTAFESCELSFGSHLRQNAHNLRFAMAETLAHLVYLENRKEIVSELSDEQIIYYTSVK